MASGDKKKKKMPKARDMAMGNKNITYLGDPYMVDGKMYDPVKEHPEDYLRPKGAKNYNTGGMCKGAGAAIKGTKFSGVFQITLYKLPMQVVDNFLSEEDFKQLSKSILNKNLQRVKGTAIQIIRDGTTHLNE